MKKVMHIRSSFEVGGTETLLANIYNADSTDLKIYLILWKGGSLISSLSNKKNFYRIIERKKKLDRNVLRETAKIISDENIEIVHTHQLIELIYSFLIRVKKPGIRLIHHVHAFDGKKNIAFYLQRFLCNFFASKVIAVSKSLYNDLKHLGYSEKKLILHLNAVKLIDSAVTSQQTETFKKLIHYSEKDQVIGMIGNFRIEKDQRSIVNAFLLLHEEFPNLKLVLIGKLNEDARKQISQLPLYLINQRIFFTGPIDYAFNCITFWRIFIFSSLNETFGIAPLEALLQKVPVIASDIKVMKELSDNGSYFSLFKTGDEVDLANTIRNELRSGKTKDQVERSYNYVNENFGIERYMNKLNLIYSIT